MKQEDINLRSLQLFIALMETNNLRRAADQIGMSIATASRKLQTLQETVGKPLFTRWSEGLIPTQDAHDMRLAVEEAVDVLTKLTYTRAFNPATMKRVIRIACIGNAAYCVLGPVFETIFKSAPHLTIDTVPVTENLFIQMRSGDIDLAIFPFKEFPNDFRSIQIYSQPTYISMAPNQPLVERFENGETVTSDELQRYRRIAISVHPSTHWPGWSKRKNVLHENIAIQTPYILFGAMQLRKSDLIMYLPKTTAQDLESLGLLRAFPSPDLQHQNEPRLLWHQRTNLDPAIQWMRALIVEHHRE